MKLVAAQDRQQSSGRNSSSGGSIGAGVSLGAGGTGFSVSANASRSKGHEKGSGVWHNETTVDAGSQVAVNSGRDATLAGAQVSGGQVTVEAGRDLCIASQQDSDDYDSRQNSAVAGGSVTFGSPAGGMTGSGYISASRDKMKSRYASVQ